MLHGPRPDVVSWMIAAAINGDRGGMAFTEAVLNGGIGAIRVTNQDSGARVHD